MVHVLCRFLPFEAGLVPVCPEGSVCFQLYIVLGGLLFGCLEERRGREVGEEGKGGRMGENRAKRRGRRKMGEDGRGGDGGEMMGEEGNRKGGEVREEGRESWGRKKKWERDQRGRLREGGGKGKRDGRRKGEMKECRGWGWGYTAQAFRDLQYHNSQLLPP